MAEEKDFKGILKSECILEDLFRKGREGDGDIEKLTNLVESLRPMQPGQGP